MEDYVIRAIAEKGTARAFIALTTSLCDEARRRHCTWPTATAALGRLLTGASMLGMTLKGQDILTLRIQGEGPLSPLTAVGAAGGSVKGYVAEPQVHLPLSPVGKLDVGRAVGRRGILYLTRDYGLKEPYTGSVPLISGEIAEDLAQYFTISEQTPSAVSLGVLVETDNSVKAAGGLILQLLPGASPELGKKLELNLKGLTSISSRLAGGMMPEDIGEEVFQGLEWKILQKQPLEFACDCSRSKLEKVLISLGLEELESLLVQHQGAQLRCHFCNKTYDFSEDDLKKLILELDSTR
ncbi:MAG TPA: Hsp33 family molecular chaperone HslO [Clostridia bacterium]|nr:Hsp33 family molecular chaperone HslO [Clostridia bacterium]